jgi:type IV secretory pathway TraG/TraD family ATPase VirD4
MGKELARITDSPVRLGTAEWTDTGATPLARAKPGHFIIGTGSDGHTLGHRDDGHVAMVCRTRGGKGISLIVPNLLEWPGSVVVIDPKGENAMVTARRRENGSLHSEGLGQKVRILDPFNIVRHRFDEFTDLKTGFNPVSLIRADCPESVDIAYRISASTLDTENAQDPFFPEAGRDFQKALILHVATSADFTDAERNLVTVRRYAQAGDVKAARLAALNAKPGKKTPSAFSLLARAMQRNHAFGGVISDAGARLIELEKSPRTLASVIQTVITALDFLDSPGMRECVSKPGFDLSELKTDPKGTSLYLCLPQRYMDTHYRWLRMMVTLVIGEMESIQGQPKSGHQVLTILDEFPALRRMRVIENAAAQIAGFGVKLVMVMQTLAQIKEIYKDNWETLFANATTKLCFGNDDQFTRQYISNLIGECEFTRATQSSNFTETKSTNSSTFSSSGHSYSESRGASHGVSTAVSGTNSVSNGSTSGASVSFSSSTGSAQAAGTGFWFSRGVSEVLQKRFLITPDEIGREFGNPNNPKVLTLISGHQPVGLQRLSYFNRREFRRKFDPHMDHPAPPMLCAWPKIEAEEARRNEERRRAEANRRFMEAERQRIAEDRAKEQEKARELRRLMREMETDTAEAKKHQHWLRRKRRDRVESAFLFSLASVVGVTIAFWFLPRP